MNLPALLLTKESGQAFRVCPRKTEIYPRFQNARSLLIAGFVDWLGGATFRK